MGDLGSDASGNLYLADAGNQSIRSFDSTNVSTYAGTGQMGYVNGFRTNALFNVPTSIARDALHNNNLYVTAR
jgi:mucin-19